MVDKKPEEKPQGEQSVPNRKQLEGNLVLLKAKVYDLNMVKNQLDSQIVMFNNQISQQSAQLQDLVAKETPSENKSPSPYVPGQPL